MRLLLQYGADPEAGNDPNDKNTMDLIQKGTTISRLLRQAIRDKIERLGDEYHPPQRWIENPRTGERTLVAYSFRARDMGFVGPDLA